MFIRAIEAADLEQLADFVAPIQQRPETHVVHLGLEPTAIVAELEETTWQEASFVAIDGDSVVGFLIADVDPEMGRVWWVGPFVEAENWESVATALLDRCREQLDESVDEEEMAFDARAERLGRWAEAADLVPDPGSLVLTLAGELEPPSVAVRPVEATDRHVLAPLHERLFPGTHTTGDVLVDSGDDTHLRIVAEVAGTIVGYIAVERHEDGSGYIDYIGVDEAQRRRGFGAQLVRAGVAALGEIDARPVHLTVRQDSPGARELYRSLGFDEERVLVPYRRGFSIP